MSVDLFRQFSESKIPPVPDKLEQSVRSEVNRWLLVMHLSELLWLGLPIAAWNLCRAVAGLFVFTLSGKFLSEKKRR